MASCEHVVCLRHVENERTGEIILEDTGRLWRVIQELPNPSTQTPQLALFIGTNAKDTALKNIFPQNNISRRGEKGNINLRLQTDSINHDAPLFFADSSPWKPSLYTVIDILYARLLFLFSDVICVFADDFSSVQAVLLRLMTWAEIGSAMPILPELRPRLLVVVSEDGPHDASQYEELQNMLQSYTIQLKNTFSAVKIFQLAGTYLSPLARYQRLQLEIRSQTQQMFDIRQRTHMLLSALHFASLFVKAVEQTAQSTSQDFNFITVSRIRNEVGSDYLEHLQTFLELARRHKTPYDSVASFIASSIIMDAYPPRMHRFPIEHVFNVLYREHCYRALETSYNDMEKRIKLQCILDDHGKLTVDLKPKTAGIRAIGVDGGGSRGATSLEFLEGLQKLLHHLPLHEMVDISCGSSSGGMIVLAKFHLQLPVERCIKVFESFAIRCFKRSKSLLGFIKSALNYVVTDAIYDETLIESLMKEIYGSSSTFFGHASNTVPGTRVAVTAMTHGSLRTIFTNYNASAKIHQDSVGSSLTPRFQDTGYIAIRPKEINEEPLIWEVARATSAAPVFFKPVKMNTGDFWDGALGFPNPTELASWEAYRLWPESVVDVAISLGTGEEPKPPRSTNSRSRLLDAFNLLLDGQLQYMNMKGASSDQELLRLNSRLARAIRLDDAESIQEQRHYMHHYPPTRQNLIEAATALLVSNFYFQLDRPVMYNLGVYYCEGSIHCRGDYHQVAHALSELYSPQIEFLTNTEILSICDLGQDICAVCHRYRKEVSFTVRHPTDSITISMRIDSRVTRKISGFPRSMSWFQQHQGFNNHFGTSSHDAPGEIRCLGCTKHSDLGAQKRKGNPSLYRYPKRIKH
ncbi:patatin-like phospholipase family protein [Aspergillus tanneri]|uniref:PNPLA domain-containing protein n=1 Tax=Aspergillus tanneri TaxID=1220188 RepID=A0A5M9MKV8_9EURO|nr:uncharacterized protein ATNIH1004_009270 [Aspergillus tanneri]KAA8645059.1 hypothetical protein ATNIH1004_009270 [Aspergillus tanneri]